MQFSIRILSVLLAVSSVSAAAINTPEPITCPSLTTRPAPVKASDCQEAIKQLEKMADFQGDRPDERWPCNKMFANKHTYAVSGSCTIEGYAIGNAQCFAPKSVLSKAKAMIAKCGNSNFVISGSTYVIGEDSGLKIFETKAEN